MTDEAPLFDLSALDFRPVWARDDTPASVPAETPWKKPGSEHEKHRPPSKRKGSRGKGNFRGGRERKPPLGPRREQRLEPPKNPFPWLRIAFSATPPAIETVVKQVRQTGKTYSLFDVARILMRNPASYTVDLTSVPPPAEGPFHIAPDGSVWLSRENAVRHILRTQMENFYRAETVEIEPPKGNFSVVAVCGMSGVLLGPPNLHDYEHKLRELHRSKFSHMNFEKFRSRLTMDRNPETIEKWRAEASRSVHYFPKDQENSGKLESFAAVERHFLDNLAAAQIRVEASAQVPGDPKSTRVDAALAPLLNHASAEEARFPLRLAQHLSRTLTEAGLRFHKGPERTTYVSVARPRHLNLNEAAVSDSIRKIIELIRSRKTIRRRELLNELAPLPSAETESPAPPPPPESPNPESSPVSDNPPKSPEESAREAITQDLLWLTHEGYVIEYADSRLESPSPPKNPPKPPPDPAAQSSEAPPTSA